MAATVGTAFVSIVPTLKGGAGQIRKQLDGEMGAAGAAGGKSFGGAFDKNADGSKAGKKFGGAFAKSAGSIAGGLAGLAIVSKTTTLFKDAIAASTDFNETISKSGQIFGKEALPALQKFAGGAAKNIGQSKQQALDAAATFATFGKSAGLAGDDLVGFSTDFTTLASDLASFHNTTPEESIEAIGAALRGEAEPIRKYGILLDDATLRQEALALGIVKNTKTALTPQQKVLAAQAAIYKQSSDAQGDFARTSGGAANQQRILAASIENAKIKIGDVFRPALEQLLPYITKFTDLMAENPTAIKIVAGLVGGILVGAFAALAVAVIAATWPFLLAGAAIGLLTVGFIWAYKNSETFRNVVRALAAQAALTGAAFLWLASKVVGGVANMVGAIAKIPSKKFDWAREAAPKLDGLATKLGKASKKTQEFANNLAKTPPKKDVKVTSSKLDKPVKDTKTLGDNVKKIPGSKNVKLSIPSLATPIKQTKEVGDNVKKIPTSRTSTLKTTGFPAGIQYAKDMRKAVLDVPTSRNTHYTWSGSSREGSSAGRTASGGIFSGAQTRLIAEAGREAVVPLDRPLNMVDPSVRWLSAFAQGKTEQSSRAAFATPDVAIGALGGGGGVVPVAVTNLRDFDSRSAVIADERVSDERQISGVRGRMG